MPGSAGRAGAPESAVAGSGRTGWDQAACSGIQQKPGQRRPAGRWTAPASPPWPAGNEPSLIQRPGRERAGMLRAAPGQLDAARPAVHAPSTVSAAMTLAAERCLWPTALHHFPGLGAGGLRHVSVSLRLLEDPRQAELVLATALGRVISINVFAAAGIGPVRRIGVTARVTALSPSAWEVSSTTHGLPAETLICNSLVRLSASDRESPLGLTRSGT